MPRGGFREGASTPTWNKGKTQTIRVPIALAKDLIKIARAIDEGKLVNIGDNDLNIDKLNNLANSVIEDEAINRKGKDKGVVKRALQEYINKLCSSYLS